MCAAIFNGPRSVTVGVRPDPTTDETTGAIVRGLLGPACGSDLDGIADVYAAKEERRAINSLVRMGSI